MKKMNISQLENTNGGWCFLGGFGSCHVQSRDLTYTNATGQACHKEYFETRIFWASVDSEYGPEHCG
jgi:hypothetical protein